MNTDLVNLNSNHPLLTGNGQRLTEAVRRLIEVDRPRYQRLWAYYRNPMRVSDTIDPSAAERPYRQAQEWGLPARVTGRVAGASVFESSEAPGVERKEVVIENDIGWRIDTMIDFLFGRAIVINSTANDPARAAAIEALLRRVLAHNGGLIFLQQLALLGAVYGNVDVLVKLVPVSDAPAASACATQLLGESAVRRQPLPSRPSPAEPASSEPSPAEDGVSATAPHADASTAPGASHPSPRDIDRLARMVRFEIVEPARALPLLDPRQCACVEAFATVYQVDRHDVVEPRRPLWQRAFTAAKPIDPKRVTVVEILTPTAWQKYEDAKLVDEGLNSLGRLPLVHIQNTPDPLSFHAAGDVEPLIPLQDELNTRLSDRANRITMTSFRMYLGKGIDNFTDMPIAPGQMWATDNIDADVVEFGGDGGCPSEESHITDVREAMDKLSGVSPVAAGAIKGKIGNLTSAAALRVTMMALISRTERKRTTYGIAIAQLCELALAWLDCANLFPTDPEERGIHIHWSNPIPTNEIENLEEAKAKQSLGIPQDIVLRELGYAPAE